MGEAKIKIVILGGGVYQIKGEKNAAWEEHEPVITNLPNSRDSKCHKNSFPEVAYQLLPNKLKCY
jgi:hypothetical protein